MEILILIRWFLVLSLYHPYWGARSTILLNLFVLNGGGVHPKANKVAVPIFHIIFTPMLRSVYGRFCQVLQFAIYHDTVIATWPDFWKTFTTIPLGLFEFDGKAERFPMKGPFCKMSLNISITRTFSTSLCSGAFNLSLKNYICI